MTSRFVKVDDYFDSPFGLERPRFRSVEMLWADRFAKAKLLRHYFKSTHPCLGRLRGVSL